MLVTIKACGWNGFFAQPGDTFASAADVKDGDGKPVPPEVLARFLKTECVAERKDAPDAGGEA